MSGEDDALAKLARQTGIVVEWIDAADRPQRVQADVLRAILQALDVPCATEREISESREKIALATRPAMIVADVGAPLSLAFPNMRQAELIFEDGGRRTVRPTACGTHIVFPPVETPGYHQLEIGDERIALAVAPRSCLRLQDVAKNDRLWGLAAQLYGLRRDGDGGIGDAAALAILAREATRHGADAIALSPTHALFSANPDKYSPYSPSSRLFLNPLFADPASLFGADRMAALIEETGSGAERRRLAALSLIDWPKAAAQKLLLLRALFEDFWTRLEANPNEAQAGAFHAFREEGGEILDSHARFEALHAERSPISADQTNWRNWPAELRDPKSPAVAAFAEAHDKDIAYHVFLQWLTDHSLASAQVEAKRAGMRVGLIADLAVGMESAGSHAWSRQSDVLVGLNIGAPPDLFNPNGQDWGLTTFSPRALATGGFAPFLATLRATLRHAGGVRIDHAMGLSRLWLIPEGARPSEGAYLTYPSADLIRLIKLESSRHRAIVIGEDLGTVPEGFQDSLSAAGIAGMDVLWFARNKEGFLPPRKWRPDAIAMTSTHDLPTLAGWWRGHDIDLREDHGLLGQAEDPASLKAARTTDREALWESFREAGTVASDAPVPEDAATAVDAAIAFVDQSPSPLMLLPLEDLLGLEEQPNLPGTIDAYPNWRRRYAFEVEDLFRDPLITARIDRINRRSRR